MSDHGGPHRKRLTTKINATCAFDVKITSNENDLANAYYIFSSFCVVPVAGIVIEGLHHQSAEHTGGRCSLTEAFKPGVAL
jgi:hypothetical protein